MVIDKGTPQTLNAVTDQTITSLVAKGEKGTVKSEASINEKVPLPLKAGQEIGKLVIYQNDKEVATYPWVAEEAVEKASFKEHLNRMISYGK